ncbi:MAG: cysteine hydrolase [Ruminococcaceae bacterium]|nr:cysteine hydrolase [Oscillospiraceae bacterium]
MKKLLIVVDMQNDFITGSLGTPEAQEILPKVAEKVARAEAEGTPVVYTRDTHSAFYPHTMEGKKLPVLHCVQDTHGWELADELKREAAIIFDKPTFGSLMLADFVTAGMFTDIELVGLCTDICVVSNALLLKAYLPEAEISVDATCCAGVTPQTHEAALTTMQQCQITIKR